MLVYIHVPFCRKRCAYCAFYSNALNHRPVPPDYLHGLHRELAWWRTHVADLVPDSKDQRVTSIFLGGGTPSLLEPADVGRLLDELAGSFALAEDAEITLEANPDSLHTRERALDFRRAGINRLSLGVQSLDEGELRIMGRIHGPEQVHQACEAIHAAGFHSFSMDLIWGLPGQSLKGWLDVLQRACALGPDHLSAYSLTLEEGTPLAEAVARGRLDLPSDEVTAAMFLEGHALLAGQGFSHYEISNYARKGHACRHNMGYWQQQDYLGLGPGAVSTLKNVRFSQPEDVGLWLERMTQGTILPETEVLSPSTRTEELVMLSLRTARGLCLPRYRQACGRDFLEENRSLVQALLKNGLAALVRHDTKGDGDTDKNSLQNNGSMYFALTPEGMLVSNDIISRFFSDMDADE